MNLLNNKKGDIVAVNGRGYYDGGSKRSSYRSPGVLVLDMVGFFWAFVSFIIGLIVALIGLVLSLTSLISIGLIWVGVSILGYVLFSKIFGVG